MGIVAEVRSAVSIVDVLPDRYESGSWAFLKAPNGSPFFRFEISDTAAASMLPVRGRWKLVVSQPPYVEFDRDVAAQAAAGDMIVTRLGRVFADVARDAIAYDRNAGLGFYLQALQCALACGDAATAVNAAVVLGDKAVENNDFAAARVALVEAQKAAFATGDPHTIESVRTRLVWVQSKLPAATQS